MAEAPDTSTAPPEVTVIIPTMATPQRGHTLRRAVDSVRNSSQRPIKILAVANGPRVDPSVCDWLRRQNDIELVVIAEGSLPGALLTGRSMVTTPWFATLDDDDEFLPGATDLKVAALRDQPDAALVVTNGYSTDGRTERLMYRHMKRVGPSPMAALFEATWLHNCNALYRTSAVGVDYFEGGHAFAEWTWLAYRFALDGLPLAVLDVPTFRYHDTQGSLSKSPAYFDSQLPLLSRMLAMAKDRPTRRLILRRLGAVHHDRSARALVRGDHKTAVASHLRSLALPGGLKYLFYGRRLLFGRRGIAPQS